MEASVPADTPARTDHSTAPGTDASTRVETSTPIEARVGAEGIDPTDESPEGGNVQLDRLVNAVLESAAVANQSAEIAARSTESLLDTVDNLDASHSLAHRKALLVLGVTGTLLLVAGAGFIWMAVHFSQRMSSLDRTLVTLTQQGEETGIRLERIEKLDPLLARIERMQVNQPAFAGMEAKLDAGIAGLAKGIAELSALPRTPAPAPAAAISSSDLRALEGAIKGLESQAQGQARTLARIGELVAASRIEPGKIAELARAIEGLAQEQRRLSTHLSQAAAQTPPPAPMAAAPASNPPPVAEKPRTPEGKRDFIQYPRRTDADSSAGKAKPSDSTTGRSDAAQRSN
jgi:hypothetical protein